MQHITHSRFERLPAFLFPSFVDEFGGLPQATYAHFLHLSYCVLPEFESCKQIAGMWGMAMTAEIDDDFRLAVSLIPAVFLHSVGQAEYLLETLTHIRIVCADKQRSLNEWLQFATQLEYVFEPFFPR